MIYFLQGTESFLFDQALANIAKASNVTVQEAVYYSANETSFATFVLEMNTDDLFGTQKLIVLKDLAEQKITQYLTGIDEQVVELLHKSDNILVIHFEREEALSKTLQQELSLILKRASIIDTKKQKTKEVIAFIQKKLKARKHNLSPQEFAAIAAKYQNNLALIQREIERVFLSKEETATITAADFKTDTQFLEEQVFKLIEALERKEVEQLMNVLDNVLLHQQNVFGLLALLLKNYKEMYQIQALAEAGYSLQQVMARLHLHPYRAKLLFAKANTLNAFQYQDILHQIITTEITLKRGAHQALAIRQLFMQILHAQMGV